MTCYTLAEIRAAALRDAKDDPPLSQAQADLIAAIRAHGQAAAS